MDKYEARLKDSPHAQATWYECEVEFESIRRGINSHSASMAIDLDEGESFSKDDIDSYCQELINDEDLAKNYELKITYASNDKDTQLLLNKSASPIRAGERVMWDELPEEEKRRSRFKPIRQDKQAWDSWSSARIQVVPIRKNDSGVFAVALVKHSYE